MNVTKEIEVLRTQNSHCSPPAQLKISTSNQRTVQDRAGFPKVTDLSFRLHLCRWSAAEFSLPIPGRFWVLPHWWWFLGDASWQWREGFPE